MTKASEMLQDKIDAINTKIQEKEGVYAAINKSATKKRLDYEFNEGTEMGNKAHLIKKDIGELVDDRDDLVSILNTMKKEMGQKLYSIKEFLAVNEEWRHHNPLALKIIDEIGGEQDFLGRYESNVLGFKADGGAMKFFNENHDEIIAFLQHLCRNSDDGSAVKHTWGFFEHRGYLFDDIATALIEKPSNDEPLSELRNLVGTVVAVNVMKELCEEYGIYVDGKEGV